MEEQNDAQSIMAPLTLSNVNGAFIRGASCEDHNSHSIVAISGINHVAKNESSFLDIPLLQEFTASSNTGPNKEELVQQIYALHKHLSVIDAVFKMKVSRPGSLP
jgi:hypothetical protein